MSVEELCNQCLDEGRRRWPQLTTSDTAMVEQLTRQLAGVDVTASAHLADLFLAAAAALDEATAVRMIHDRLLAVSRSANRMILTRSELDEVVQQVAMRLLVARPPDPPQIVKYLGTGPLDAWLRAVVLRAALTAHRKASSAASPVALDDAAWLEIPLVLDDKRVLIPRLDGAAYRRAFREAIAALTPRQRTLLRQYFIDGVAAADLGRIYGVHRVTVFRWIGEAKASVLDAIREFVRATVGGSASEIESIVRSLRSGFSVSVEGLLQAHD